MVTNLARTWGNRLIQPIARFLQSLGLTPNIVTVTGFVLTAAVSVVLASGRLQLAGLLLIITLGADGLDGALARLTNSVTRFGAFLDSTLDRWAEVCLYTALAYHFLQVDSDVGVMLSICALSASLLVSYTRARAEGVGLVCKKGLLTRLERIILLILGLILGQILVALWVIAILAGLTALQRIWVTWMSDRDSR